VPRIRKTLITICDHKPRGREGETTLAISQDRISKKDIQNLLYSRRLKREREIWYTSLVTSSRAENLITYLTTSGCFQYSEEIYSEYSILKRTQPEHPYGLQSNENWVSHNNNNNNNNNHLMALCLGLPR